MDVDGSIICQHIYTLGKSSRYLLVASRVWVVMVWDEAKVDKQPTSSLLKWWRQHNIASASQLHTPIEHSSLHIYRSTHCPLLQSCPNAWLQFSISKYQTPTRSPFTPLWKIQTAEFAQKSIEPSQRKPKNQVQSNQNQRSNIHRLTIQHHRVASPVGLLGARSNCPNFSCGYEKSFSDDSVQNC